MSRTFFGHRAQNAKYRMENAKYKILNFGRGLAPYPIFQCRPQVPKFFFFLFYLLFLSRVPVYPPGKARLKCRPQVPILFFFLFYFFIPAIPGPSIIMRAARATDIQHPTSHIKKRALTGSSSCRTGPFSHRARSRSRRRYSRSFRSSPSARFRPTLPR